MSKWTCAGCGIEVIDGLKTCACDTMVMVEDGGLGRSEWMHYPVAPPDLELAILECKTFEDFLAVQETVAVLPAATALAHLNGPDSSMVEPGYQRPGFDSPSGPPSLASPSKRVERLEAATHRHVKRGSEYVLIGYGKMQAERWLIGDTLAYSVDSYTVAEIKAKLGVDMREVAIYRSVEDGSLWVRPREEFEDGRFQALGDRS